MVNISSLEVDYDPLGIMELTSYSYSLVMLLLSQDNTYLFSIK